MIDSQNARKYLDALSKYLGVLQFGAHSYDGVELLVCACDKKLSQIVELKKANRLRISGSHSSEWYELALPKSFRMSINESSIIFKAYRFLKLKDIAYHLKMSLADVEVAIARTVLKQALGAGVYVEKHDGSDGKTFKLRSLEELSVLRDLLG